MTDQEIDKWVEDHIKFFPDKGSNLRRRLIKWGRVIVREAYNLGKEEMNNSRGNSQGVQ